MFDNSSRVRASILKIKGKKDGGVMCVGGLLKMVAPETPVVQRQLDSVCV